MNNKIIAVVFLSVFYISFSALSTFFEVDNLLIEHTGWNNDDVYWIIDEYNRISYNIKKNEYTYEKGNRNEFPNIQWKACKFTKWRSEEIQTFTNTFGDYTFYLVSGCVTIKIESDSELSESALLAGQKIKIPYGAKFSVKNHSQMENQVFIKGIKAKEKI